jgi:cholesterol oxidase
VTNTPAAGPDAIVVGSGFGGSVSAARLAERGYRVLLLERGPWWGHAPAASERSARLYPRGLWGVRKLVRGLHLARGGRGRSLVLSRDGLLELHLFDRLVALTASGVGGGSLIYADVLVEPDPAFFKYFPAEISAEEMRPYYQRVRETLRPSPLPERPRRTAVFERAVASAGLPPPQHPDLAVAWPPADTTSGRLASSILFGCEHAGKQSLDKTYVPLALRHGTDVRALSEVVRLERTRLGYRVTWLDHVARRHCHAAAPVVVIAAGTLGTLRLLSFAREQHSLALPSALGQRFSGGGDMMAFLDRFPGAGDSPYGPCVGAGIFVERNGEHRYLIGEMGASADALPLPAVLQRRLRDGAILSAMGRDASNGSLSFDGHELRTATGRSLDPELFADVQESLSSIATGYHARRMWLNPPGGPNSRWLMTVHPMGGAGIGNTVDDGVVDHTGEVFGNPGLYVADASVFPRAPGLPPAMTIAALAERQVAMIGGLSTRTQRHPISS